MDELDRALRDLLTDERLDLPLATGAARIVQEGVRRRRRRNTALAVTSVAAAVVAIATVGVVLTEPGSSVDRPIAPVLPTVGSPTPTAATKPPLPQSATTIVPWADTPYDYRQPPAFAGAAARPGVPWCKASHLTLVALFQGATGDTVGGLNVRNTGSTPCALQGQPAVRILTGNRRVLVSSTPEPFYVDPWVELAPGATTSAEVDWHQQFCGESPPARIVADLPHGGGELSAPMTDTPRCDASGGPPTAGRLDVDGFLPPSGAGWTPDANLVAAVSSVPQTLVAGQTLTYRLRLQSSTQQPVTLDPCLPFRERLVGPSDGTIAVEELHVLNCEAAPAAIDPPDSEQDVEFTLQLRLPPTMPTGDYALLWQSVIKSVSATAPDVVHVTSAPPQCAEHQLTLSKGRGGAATGHYSDVVVLTNNSATACSLRGHPGVQWADANHRPLPTKPHYGGSFTFPDLPMTTVVLAAHGGTASFAVGGIDFVPPAGTAPCTATSGLLVIPPNLRDQVFVAGVGDDCQDGEIDVSVVVAGSAGPRF